MWSAAVLAILLSALLGGFYGRSVLATEDGLPQHYQVFTAALNAIEENYVERPPSDRLVYSAIGGLLQTLDPHSTFLDPATYRQMRERQEGHYKGLGITIAVIDGDITVQALFEGSPASAKGIRRGDVIARIEGESAKGWTSQQAVDRLRGPKGTTVKISIRREGYDNLLDFEVPRDDINMKSVTASLLLNGGTGYVKVQDFAENTSADLGAALRELRGKGMKRLVLDLRGNPGGPLDQAISVTNRFLPKDKLIVYTRGRVPNSDQDYFATEAGSYTDIPMIVLVSRNSASASEIVAGALQDYDRALVVGETTFGKALVQSVYRISEGAGLALTTARYFTPSGRMIQRPWDGTFDEYLNYTLQDQSANRPRSPELLHHTAGNREVYGGGGIEPDKRFEGPTEGFNPSRFSRNLYGRQLFADFAQRFTAQGDTRVPPRKDGRVVARGFAVDAAIVHEFRAFLTAQKMKIDEASFQQDLPFIKAMIRYEVDFALFGVTEARENLVGVDPQLQFALGLFPEAQKLSELGQTSRNAGRRR